MSGFTTRWKNGSTQWLAEPKVHQTLDAVRDPGHWTYKIPGLVVWGVLGGTLATAVLAPDLALFGIRLFGLYIVARVVLMAFFYGTALIRVQLTRRRIRRHLELAGPSGRLEQIHHVVIVPNYKEPVEVLAGTLRALAVQHSAQDNLTVVLAMEEKEASAAQKASALAETFAHSFARLLVTYHPANLPDEIPGKAANQGWAARVAKHELVDRLGIPIDAITITSCDADSQPDPDYFAEVTRRFARDPERHFRFWQAPIQFTNNIWSVPPVVRLWTFLKSALHYSELANPLVTNLPLSTYTMSLRLADAVGYWDGAVIAEDFHMFLRCFFATKGQVSLVPIFLPASGNAVSGPNAWQAARNLYDQHLRHAWGCQDVGYVVQQWLQSPHMPVARTLRYFVMQLHDHVIFSLAPFVLTIGALLTFDQNGSFFLGVSALATFPIFLEIGNGVGVICTWLIWFVAHMLTARTSRGWRSASFFGEVATWLVFPLLTLLLVGLPVLHAQTRMMLGLPLDYAVTPK